MCIEDNVIGARHYYYLCKNNGVSINLHRDPFSVIFQYKVSDNVYEEAFKHERDLLENKESFLYGRLIDIIYNKIIKENE